MAHFLCEPDPAQQGWHRYELGEPGQYNRAVLGDLIIRAEGSDHCRTRLHPMATHHNSAGNIHGGIILGLIDESLFAAICLLRGIPVTDAVTLDVQAQFIGVGDASRPLDSVAELLRETRRLVFLRGLVVQDDDLVASFTATVRKASQPR